MDRSPAYPGLEEALSADRFATYLAWAGHDRHRALALYTLNAQLAESFYTPLHMLEVALRNRIHDVMRAAAGDTWFDAPAYQVNAVQADMLAKARRDLAGNRKVETPGAIVAALTFGYWTAMLGREYENLWQTTLKDIARRVDGKGLRRKDLAVPLGPIRALRNRLAHHETVLHWDLPKYHASVLQLTGWLSPVAAEWSKGCSRFESIYPSDGILLPSSVQPPEADRRTNSIPKNTGEAT